MTLLGVLGMGRKMANARMTETVRIGTLTYGDVPEGEIDPEQVFEVEYEGPARVSWNTYTVQQTTPGDQPVALSTPILSIPSGTFDVTVDMRAVVDASTADLSLVGRTFRIKGLPQSGQTTALRYPLEESGEVIEETS